MTRRSHLAILLFITGLLLVACSPSREAGSLPAPAPPPPGDWARMSVDVRAYLVEVEPYTDTAHLALAPQLSVAYLEGVVSALEALQPPAEMEAAHETLLKGYRLIAEGRRLIADNVRDNRLREEGHNMTDWGLLRLNEHVQMVAAYLQSLPDVPAPSSQN